MCTPYAYESNVASIHYTRYYLVLERLCTLGSCYCVSLYNLTTVLILSSLAKDLYFLQNAEGSGLAPFDCWICLRGIKTMALRVEKQQVLFQTFFQSLELVNFIL